MAGTEYELNPVTHITTGAIGPAGKRVFYLQAEVQYHYLRECELGAALAETRADLAAGRKMALADVWGRKHARPG